ncbi:uncharacterized protein LOC143030103 [Oratosquilla oratoria]|uniref:uncharacterized protein LOC143030103 n=1 Tax=Oratosquilla oratoria TaxID=337810 RepID=UPI003F75ADB4
MIRKFLQEQKNDWEEGLPFLLFAARTAVQDSLGCSPASLLFGHEVRGPLKMVKEKWMEEEVQVPSLQYLSQVQEKLVTAWEIATENLESSQKIMKVKYDRKAKPRSFSPGHQVLVYLPVPGEPLMAKYQGPYTILEKNSSLNYIIQTPEKRKTKRPVHINALKPFYHRVSIASYATVGVEEIERIFPQPELPL